jgi:hypothetical protein
MKTIRLWLFMGVLLLVSGLHAGSYKYLIFQTTDGSKTSVFVSDLKLAYNNGQLTATQNGTTATFTVSDLSKMWFTADLTAIQEVESPNTAVSLDGSALKINAPVGSVAKVYDANGRMVMSCKIASDGSPAHVNLLDRGIYVVKAGSETLKILVK